MKQSFYIEKRVESCRCGLVSPRFRGFPCLIPNRHARLSGVGKPQSGGCIEYATRVGCPPDINLSYWKCTLSFTQLLIVWTSLTLWEWRVYRSIIRAALLNVHLSTTIVTKCHELSLFLFSETCILVSALTVCVWLDPVLIDPRIPGATNTETLWLRLQTVTGFRPSPWLYDGCVNWVIGIKPKTCVTSKWGIMIR